MILYVYLPNDNGEDESVLTVRYVALHWFAEQVAHLNVVLHQLLQRIVMSH